MISRLNKATRNKKEIFFYLGVIIFDILIRSLSLASDRDGDGLYPILEKPTLPNEEKSDLELKSSTLTRNSFHP